MQSNSFKKILTVLENRTIIFLVLLSILSLYLSETVKSHIFFHTKVWSPYGILKNDAKIIHQSQLPVLSMKFR